MVTFTDSTGYLIVMTVVTIFVLFADDVQQVAVQKKDDAIFYILYIIFMFIFGLEIVMFSICQKDYFLSFFFFLDILSTLSFLFDIKWFTDLILPSNNVDSTANAASIARAARASRISTKITRLIWVMRLIKVVHLMRIYREEQEKRMESDLGSS